MANIGKSITESATFLSKVGAECDLLATLVTQELSSLFSGGPVGKRYQVDGAWIPHYDTDEHGWVYVNSAHSLPLIIKPKRSVGAYLFFQISLVGDRIAAVGNDQPLMHVGLWSVPVDQKYWMGFPVDADDSAPSLEDGRLFKWPENEAGWQEWNYSLRLADINTVQDVRDMIVEPVRALLLGDSVSDALPHSLRGIVHYSPVESHPGQYRVEQ